LTGVQTVAFPVFLLTTDGDGADPPTVPGLAAAVGVDQPRLERALMLLEAGGFVRAEEGRVHVADLDGLLRFVIE
jgi:hypothetical protein